MEKQITAIVETYEQTGPDTFNTVRFSRNFKTNRSIHDILSWATTMLERENVSISDIKFASFTGTSM